MEIDTLHLLISAVVIPLVAAVIWQTKRSDAARVRLMEALLDRDHRTEMMYERLRRNTPEFLIDQQIRRRSDWGLNEKRDSDYHRRKEDD